MRQGQGLFVKLKELHRNAPTQDAGLPDSATCRWTGPVVETPSSPSPQPDPGTEFPVLENVLQPGRRAEQEESTKSHHQQVGRVPRVTTKEHQVSAITAMRLENSGPDPG